MFLYDNLHVNTKGNLVFAGLDTVEMSKKYGTPLFLMDEGRIRQRCRLYKESMKKYFGDSSLPLYASKALSFKRMYQIMAEEEMGIDIVSSGELHTAIKANFPLERAYFHGNNKTKEDIEYALKHKIGYFICDNIDEVSLLDEKAAEFGIKQKILLRLTPGIDPHTNKKISTGSVDSKFGAAIETGQAELLIRNALEKNNLILCGYHCHIGSQIFDIEPFSDAADIMLTYSAYIKEKLGYEAQIINLGGGMGVPYTEKHPEIDYAENIKGISEIIKEKCKELNLNMPRILMEPGRSIVADSGITLYTVGSVKEIKGFKNYVSIDGGMTDNPRYTLYESPYTVLVANKAKEAADYNCTIAGRCCESGDLIQENVNIQNPERGDILAVLTTGAYNYSMASNYNRLPRPPIVMIKDKTDYLAVRRESLDDLIQYDI